MALSLNKPKLDNLASDIWKSAERLRGKFKSYEYQSVILPIIVIRRLECVLIDWRTKKAADVLKNRPKLTEKELAKLVKELELNPKQCPFSNTTDWTLRSVYEEDHALLEKNFRAYINGFSKNVDDIIEHFNYRATIGLMVKNNRLAPILNQYKELALGPDQLSGLEMGYIYEELLRRFSEQSGDEAGEHFTPREVIRLMVELLDIPIPDKHLSIYDPASGTGGMLSVAKEHLLERADTAEEKSRVEKFVTVHGQELSPTNYAVCQADLLIKNDRQATVYLGNSLIPHDKHSKEPGDQWPEPKWRFNRMLSNPPFGVTWGGKDGYEKEARKLEKTRYRAGMPRVNDGALLFLQTMLAKMATPEEGGSRIAIIFNGSPLSNGDCGSGESEIRRWILENDWLDAIVMLPDQLFYNTGIFKPRFGGDDTFFVSLLESQDFSLFVTGAAQPKLTMENLGRFKLAIPRVPEQKEIAAFIRKKDAEFHPLLAQIERQIETLVSYRKSLIHECVTGQRRITDADLRKLSAAAILPADASLKGGMH